MTIPNRSPTTPKKNVALSIQTANSTIQKPDGLWGSAFAMAGAVNAPISENWYRIVASSSGAVEIYIYDEIGGWGITARQFANDLKSRGDVRNIVLRIHSPGGDVFEGMVIYNLLNQHPAYITVYIDGLAASMASVIAMVGDVVIIPMNAAIMIHKPWGIQGGDADDMRRYADLLDQVEDSLVSAYTKKTGKTVEEIKQLLDAETWMFGQEAVELGFADMVAEPLQAAASLNSKRLQEFTHMPEQFKAFLGPRAQTPPAAPTHQPAPQPAASVPTPTPTPSPTPAAGLSVADLQARNNEIQNLFANFGGRHQDLMIEALANPAMTLEAVKDKLLAAFGATTTPSNTPSASAHIYADNGNIVGDAMKAALMMRCGHKAEGTDDKKNPYAGMTLREMARMALTERGIGVAGQTALNIAGMAFTHASSDFGNILLDVAHKSVLMGWEGSTETFEEWTYKGQLSDFKPAARVGMDSFKPLRQVRDGAEYKYVTVGDRAEMIALATYGELFSISRQTIINDDMQMLLDIPMMMGEAAKATIGDLVYGVLIGNVKMSDGKALFHADHGNMFDASAGVSVATLGGARQKMLSQTAADGKRKLNIRPGFVLTPTALELEMIQTIESGSIKGADVNAQIKNPLQNFAKVIAEPRLDDQATFDWYLAAGKGRDTIEVAYLDGVDTPYIEQQQGFTVDGVATKVRIDAGVAPRDFRGLVKSKGTAKA
ncbi:Clp protease ClpP [Vibrio cholerae]|uniref:ClpP-like prohead protease/major capsid protein fusion protein n=1 Tax=Vibrio cholerae TaxID=666 RepID=UPI00293446F4|nr:ClpP-like prohead protease/major capsid protein fusion protein [Vibrio cholerae]MDV2340905.1 Clp protease ClpP [Vibrio cholerae]